MIKEIFIYNKRVYARASRNISNFSKTQEVTLLPERTTLDLILYDTGEQMEAEDNCIIKDLGKILTFEERCLSSLDYIKNPQEAALAQDS